MLKLIGYNHNESQTEQLGTFETEADVRDACDTWGLEPGDINELIETGEVDLHGVVDYTYTLEPNPA